MKWDLWAGERTTYIVMKDMEMVTATEPGDPPAAVIAQLNPKTTYRIKVIALNEEGAAGEEFAERNISTAGIGQTYKNARASVATTGTDMVPPGNHHLPHLIVCRASTGSHLLCNFACEADFWAAVRSPLG